MITEKEVKRKLINVHRYNKNVLDDGHNATASQATLARIVLGGPKWSNKISQELKVIMMWPQSSLMALIC